jgi:hypothetical protein
VIGSSNLNTGFEGKISFSEAWREAESLPEVWYRYAF